MPGNFPQDAGGPVERGAWEQLKTSGAAAAALMDANLRLQEVR